MKVLVTGADGQLGYDVVKELNKRNIDCYGATIKDFDLTDEKATKGFILDYKPDAVIHCAAYTAVDKAEEEKELCYAVNTLGTRYVAEAVAKLGLKIIYISTDYVFDGTKPEPYEVWDQPNPINHYGYTKYLGEEEVKKLTEKYFIVRTSWVFGENGNNFVKTMLALGKQRSEIRVVSDQIGSPTYTKDLARLLVDMVQTDKYGIYHATNEGYCSWYEFAVEIFKQAGMNVKIIPITSEEYPTKAKRPRNSRLDKSCLDRGGFGRLERWEAALDFFLFARGSKR